MKSCQMKNAKSCDTNFANSPNFKGQFTRYEKPAKNFADFNLSNQVSIISQFEIR